MGVRHWDQGTKAEEGGMIWKPHQMRTNYSPNGAVPVHSAEFIASALALWRGGFSATSIGDKLGVSKNVIIGIAHRNNFPPRPSPIKPVAI